MADLIERQAAIDAIVDKGATGDSEVKCLSCGHRIAERPFEVYCNIMCKWVNEKDYCSIFEPRTHYGEEKEDGRFETMVTAKCVAIPSTIGKSSMKCRKICSAAVERG